MQCNMSEEDAIKTIRKTGNKYYFTAEFMRRIIALDELTL